MPKKYPWQRWPTKQKKKKKKTAKKQSKPSSWGKSSIQDLKVRLQTTRGKIARLEKEMREKEKRPQEREQPPIPP